MYGDWMNKTKYNFLATCDTKNTLFPLLEFGMQFHKIFHFQINISIKALFGMKMHAQLQIKCCVGQQP